MGWESLLVTRILSDRYRLDGLLGAGGMGAVFRATDLHLEREVAVKVIALSAAMLTPSQEVLRRRFRREARIAASIRHENVISIYDFGIDPTLQMEFMVLELLEGEDLSQILARQAAPDPEWGLEILRQAAQGVAAGHRQGLIHRDLKPGNLFVLYDKERVRVRVLDFGIALPAHPNRTLTHLTRAGSTPHTPAHAAPEQLAGAADLTPACDVFSLGTIAFHLMMGRSMAPDGGQAGREETIQVAQAALRNAPLPYGLSSVIATCLAVQPSDRFPDASVLSDALLAACAPPSIKQTLDLADRKLDLWICPSPIDVAAEVEGTSVAECIARGDQIRDFLYDDSEDRCASQEPALCDAALGYYRAVIHRDPDAALAWIGVAEVEAYRATHVWDWEVAYTGNQRRSILNIALGAIRRALRLSPESARAWVGYGRLLRQWTDTGSWLTQLHPADPWVRQARAAVRYALFLDPACEEAQWEGLSLRDSPCRPPAFPRPAPASQDTLPTDCVPVPLHKVPGQG